MIKYRLLASIFCFFSVIHAQETMFEQLQHNERHSVPLFCPGGHVKEALCFLIAHEKERISLAAYNLTCRAVIDELLAAKERGIKIEIIIDTDGLHYTDHITCLWHAGIPIYIVTAKNALMHNKYVIFSKNIYDQSLLWTGSANFTERGLTKNFENVLILSDGAVIEEFQRNFDAMKETIKIQFKKYALYHIIS